MKKILVLVEGQTEEQFIKKVIYDYFYQQDIFLIPVIIETKEVKSGPNYKGGINSYGKIKEDLQKLLGDSSAVIVTTMIDYYGLPNDFPAFNRTGTCYQKIEAAEKAFAAEVNNHKFIPYLQLHEFEGILFASPKAISDTMDTSRRSITIIQKIRDRFNYPEEINEGTETHPSKRIQKLFSNYNKPFHGTLISTRIGVQQLLNNCPHFKQWIESLLEKSRN